jgi:hypothetical protein
MRLALCGIGSNNPIDTVFGRRNMLSSLHILLLDQYFNLLDCLITITHYPITISNLCFPTVAPEDKSMANATLHGRIIFPIILCPFLLTCTFLCTTFVLLQ